MNTVDFASLTARLDEVASRYLDLERLAADPVQAKDQRAYRELMQEFTRLASVVRERDELQALSAQIGEAQELSEVEEDEGMQALAEEELQQLQQQE